jgi:hypothetical protein
MVYNSGFIWKSIFSTLSKMYFLFLVCIMNVLFGGTKRVNIFSHRFTQYFLWILYYWPQDEQIWSEHVATIQHIIFTNWVWRYSIPSLQQSTQRDNRHETKHGFLLLKFHSCIHILSCETGIINLSNCFCMLQSGPYLHTGHRGLGPGRHIRKSRLKYGMRKKKAVHEREI